MSTAAIVAVVYDEPEYEATRKCIDKCNCLKVFVDRQGTGSLAKAYNEGFATLQKHCSENDIHIDYVWFVSNPTWQPGAFEALVKAMDSTGYAAIHPAFNSDHAHLRPDGLADGAYMPVLTIPYIEFTAPMVRVDVFEKHKLDELMPYWGHDIAWSHEVKKDFTLLAVHHGVQLQHTYIRHNKNMHPITAKRHALRKQSNAATTARLVELYGENWQDVLGYRP